jgi:DNA-binding beta-propeller fold protein YncE
MSNLSDLYPSGGGGTPINGLAQFANAPVLYDALDGGTYLQAGNIITNFAAYPDAIVMPLEIKRAVYSQDFSVASQDLFPTGIFFRADGLKMYIVGSLNNKVYEYNLSTAWNITTAVYSQDFSVASQEQSLQGIFFRPDGLKMYIVGALNDKVYEYNLSTAWNITTAVYSQDFRVGGLDSQPTGIFFRPDGLKMYIVGALNDKVYEYNLSTAWNITTAVYSQDFRVNLQDNSPQGIFFRPDGLKMYMVGLSNDRVYEYNLSTAWNITTAVYSQDFSVASQDTIPTGIFFRADGLKMYIVGQSNDRVYEYNLPPESIGLDLSTGLDANTYVRIK